MESYTKILKVENISIGNLIKTLGNEFIFGGHLLSIGAASIVWSILIMLGISINPTILLLSYLISQIVYNFDHLKEKGLDNIYNIERTNYLRQSEGNRIVIMIVYILAFISVTFLIGKWSVIALSVILLASGLLYTIRFKKIARKIMGFKSLYVSFFWAGLVFLPLFYYSLSFRIVFFVLFVFIFSRFMVSTVFFDFKDIESDKKEELKTFPITLGIKNTLKLQHFINVVSGLILISTVFLDILPRFTLTLLIFTLYSFYYLVRVRWASQEEIRKISYILVDGEYFLWPIALLLGKLILGI